MILESYAIQLENKYNPKFRNQSGAYKKNEWTARSDIGKIFVDGILTLNTYQKIEESYCNAVLNFMSCNNISNLKIIGLEKRKLRLKNNPKITKGMLNLFHTIKNDALIEKNDIKNLCKLILREDVWCKLENEKMFVHFGYDYYMYIGSIKKCKNTLDKIKNSGLFVESFISPHLITEENHLQAGNQYD